MSTGNIIDNLKERIAAAEKDGKNSKAKLLRAQLRKERAKVSNARALKDSSKKKNKPAGKDDGTTKTQSGAGKSILAILRDRMEDAEKDADKDLK